MKFFEQINDTTMKVAKGMLAIFMIKLLLLVGIFIFQSCQSENINNEFQEEAKTNFLASLKQSHQDLKTLPISNSKNIDNKMSRTQGDIEYICITEYNRYLDLTEEELVEEIENSVANFSEFIEKRTVYDLITQFDKNFDTNGDTNQTEEDTSSEEYADTTPEETNDFNTDDCIAVLGVEVQPIVDALQPAIQDAKNYLYTKGFTEQTLNDMIAEENGTEEDLVLLVMAMMEIEGQQSSSNQTYDFTNLFFNSAYAQQNTEITAAEVGYCAAVAIGADILWALGGSSASAWTIPAMKKAFGAVAKRFLGPIGVAIAVVTFGICLYDASMD